MVTNSRSKNESREISDNHGNRNRSYRYFDFKLLDPPDFTPSPLQIKLYEEAKHENIIICLENDITKTFVSIMLIDYFSFKTKSTNDQIKQKILIIESTEQTIDQRINFILNNIDLKCLIFKKENLNCEFENKFLNEFELNELLICESEVATKLFDLNLIKIEDFCLIIFNDIHQNYDNFNNLKIMNYYEKAEPKPRILSFCISLINNESTTKRMNSLIRKMEINFNSKCKASVSTFNYKSKEIIVKIKPTSIDFNIRNEFRDSFSLIISLIKFLDHNKIKPKNENTIKLKNTRKYLDTFLYVIEELGLWPAKALIEIYINELSELISNKINSDPTYATALSSLNSLFYYLRSILDSLFKNYTIYDIFIKLSSSRLRCLVSILSDNLKESTLQSENIKKENIKPNYKEKRLNHKKFLEAQFSCIIFAKSKEIVRVLSEYLKEISNFDIEGCFNLKPECIVYEKRIAKNFDELKPNKKQEEIISKFKKFEYNTLVITSSIELDLPKCKFVIRFDLPSTSKEYIQSKERLKPENSKLIFIVNENTNEAERLLEFVKQEKILILKFKDNLDNEDDKKLKELNIDLKEIEKQIPSFKPQNSKISINPETSICFAVINRYCSKLPSDSFTKLFPRWKIDEKIDEHTGLKLFRCNLNLPINSPIRYEINGDYCLTRKLAKKSAAIKACQKLYECGEIDNQFQPICKENIKCIDELELIEEQQLNEINGNQTGTTKKRRYYNKKVADVLTGRSLTLNEDYYFYIFTMNLTCSIPDEQNTRGRKIIDPADYDRNFGLIIRNKLPKICKFPVFTRSGEVMVDLKCLPKKIKLEKQVQLDRLIEFHKFTFKNVLHLEKYPMKFDYANSNCTYLVVPINYDVKQPDDKLELAEIDWNFIQIVEDYQQKLLDGGYLKTCDLTSKDRPKFEFKQELYEDAVIKPLYHKNDHHFYFYVAEIFKNLNPSSPFTNDGYESFADYYKTKYNTEITNLTQPLLDVDYTSARLNLLTPRYVNRKGITLPMSTAKTKKEIRNNLEKKQLLVPEICIVHPFPASFWKKAVCLPSILYRVNCLLLAEELRKEVAIAVKIGKVELDENESWPTLDFGWTLADALNNCLNTTISETEIKEENNNKSKESNQKSTNSTCKDDKSINNESIENKKSKNDDNFDNYEIDVFDPTMYKPDENIEEFDSDNSDDPEMEADFFNNLVAANGDIFNANNAFDLNTGPNMASLFNGSTFSFGKFNDKNKQDLSEDNNSQTNNWNLDEKNDDFVDCGMNGLMSISEVDNLNIENLSRDIAKLNTDDVDLLDNYISDDNLSRLSNIEDIEYEEDAEFDPSFTPNIIKKPLFSKPSLVEDEYLFDIQTNGLMIDNKAIDSNVSELTKICNNLKENELIQDTIVQNVDLSHFEIKEFKEFKEFKDTIAENNDDLKKEDDNKKNSFKLSEIVNVLKERINYNSKEATLMNTCNNKRIDKDNEKKINDNIDQDENFQPGFGELLPINKSTKEIKKSTTTNTLNECSRFNIKFDPFKEDQTNCLGPDPSIILQALTMSNASDGINLERLETVGDSFLKYAVTAYLYCTYDKIHEGKLSHLRSKQISNYNLFRLGKEKGLGEIMVATKFEPSDNWLAPGFVIPPGLDKVLVDLSLQNSANIYDLNALKHLSLDNITENELRKEIEKCKDNCIISTIVKDVDSDDEETTNQNYENALANLSKKHNKIRITDSNNLKEATHIPYNLLTQHTISDKSIADCVESLIGSYLISCGTKSALLFMKWLGIKVMPDNVDKLNENLDDPKWHWLPKIESPLCLSENIENYLKLNEIEKTIYLNEKMEKLNQIYLGSNLNRFEKEILNYEFNDKSYLVQAFTHNSYYDNRVTDCYQRLEFLGDAVLDFLITRYLFEDPAKHTPGTLTDLRSALVNNTFFASLAVKYDFQKYIKILSADLMRVITNFVNKVNKDDSFINSTTFGLCIEEGESENLEDVQVPKALGCDVFESIAGAIYLDSGLSLDAVWEVYFRMMKPEIEYFSKNVPKSPIRELLEMKPQNVKFSKPEIIKGKKSVTVEVFGEGTFVGIGRNKRFAKCTAAKKALKHLKSKLNKEST